MDKLTFSLLLSDTATAIAENRLSDTIRIVESLLTAAPNWQLSQEVNEVKDTYQQLLAFFAEGMEDTQREQQYTALLRRVARIYDILYHQYIVTQTDTHFSQTAKTLQKMSLPEDFEAFFTEKRAGRTLFEKVYTSQPWTSTTLLQIIRFIEHDATETEALLLLSGAMMGGLTIFDANKWALFLHFCQSDRPSVQVRSMVGAVFMGIKYKERQHLYPEIEQQLSALTDSLETKQQLQQLQLQLFVSLDTESIKKKMEEEVLPTIIETSKEISKKNDVREDNFLEKMSSLHLNPEWEQKGLLSKATDSIRKIYEWQKEGADVYLSSFAALKNNFPFFRIAANWFLPFTMDNPDWDTLTRKSEFGKGLEQTPLLCNSDKYSFIYLFRSFPEAQRKMAEQQLAQAFTVTFNLSEGGEKSSFSDLLRVYLQDLYRFFRLFNLPENKEINPFQLNLLFSDHSILHRALSDKGILLEVADLLFKQKNYYLANTLFSKAASFEQDNAAVAAEMFQKIGFCYQLLGNPTGAISAYEKSLLFSSASIWTMRQIIACYQQLGDYKGAQKVAKQLLEKSPDDQEWLLLIAQLHLLAKEYAEARQHLLKLVYFEEKPGEAVRALAWCYLLSGDYPAALEQYEKILPQKKAADSMNAGHCAWLCGNPKDAITHYREYLKIKQLPYADADFFAEDKALLQERGVTAFQQTIMLDTIN